MKRTPLKRGASQFKRTPLERGRSELKRTEMVRSTKPIRQATPKRAADKAQRARLVARLANEGVRCEVCPELARHGIVVACTGRIQGLHERRKRSSAGATTVAANLIPACNLGNGSIENRAGDVAALPDEVRRWFVLREGDPEWEAMSVRSDATPIRSRLCTSCGQAFVTVPPSGVLTCGHSPSRTT